MSVPKGERAVKVIAKVDNTRVLCEVTMEEICFLNGFRSRYDQGVNIDTLAMVGAECNLKKMVTTSQYVRSLNPEVLETAKKQIEKALEIVESAQQEVTKLDLFNILKEEEQIG